jgi:carboxypeptidase C (cathepsin A)
MGAGGSGYLSVAGNLQRAMQKHPNLKLLFACGQYDLATPFLGATYSISHLNINADMRHNITQKFYPSGHMIYQHRPSALKLHDDIKAFMHSAIPGNE